MSRDIKLGSIVSAFIFLSIALTIPLNLGGYITNYGTLYITLFYLPLYILDMFNITYRL